GERLRDAGPARGLRADRSPDRGLLLLVRGPRLLPARPARRLLDRGGPRRPRVSRRQRVDRRPVGAAALLRGPEPPAARGARGAPNERARRPGSSPVDHPPESGPRGAGAGRSPNPGAPRGPGRGAGSPPPAVRRRPLTTRATLRIVSAGSDPDGDAEDGPEPRGERVERHVTDLDPWEPQEVVPG